MRRRWSGRRMWSARPRGSSRSGWVARATLPLNTVVAKEITLRGRSGRRPNFGSAVDLINSKQVSLMPLLTAPYPGDQAIEAFEFAGDPPDIPFGHAPHNLRAQRREPLRAAIALGQSGGIS